jgi:phospholipid/cholesterol/gamma-HCH transport system permease protein
MKKEYFILQKRGGRSLLKCLGEWTIYTTADIVRDFDSLERMEDSHIELDFHEVDSFDSGGILLLIDLRHRLLERGKVVEISGLDEKQKKMLLLLEKSYSREKLPRRYENPFARIGKIVVGELLVVKEFASFIGELFISFVRLLAHPSNFRLRETAYHIEKSGFDALFIIALTSILVGLVIAYQSIVQLSRFGADIFVVDVTGISVTRELGPMITAIVIAGRSASSYAAEIGTMKLTEEISAMRTMGFDPYFFLVIPRIVALMISMPLLIFFSDIMGILGGMVATNLQSGLTFEFFINRIHETLEVKQYILGMIKGPFFAFIIAATGSFHGFRVTADTESIGIETTASVVHAIFFVIACDALFSVIYTQFGL